MCVRVVSATPPSIAIEALVLGGPEDMRVVLNSSSKFCVRVVLVRPRMCGPRPWGRCRANHGER